MADGCSWKIRTPGDSTRKSTTATLLGNPIQCKCRVRLWRRRSVYVHYDLDRFSLCHWSSSVPHKPWQPVHNGFLLSFWRWRLGANVGTDTSEHNFSTPAYNTAMLSFVLFCQRDRFQLTLSHDVSHKSDLSVLCDTSWERVSWKRSRWPGLSKIWKYGYQNARPSGSGFSQFFGTVSQF